MGREPFWPRPSSPIISATAADGLTRFTNRGKNMSHAEEAFTLEPRIVDTPIRLPYPPAKFDDQSTKTRRNRYFAFDDDPMLSEDAD